MPEKVGEVNARVKDGVMWCQADGRRWNRVGVKRAVGIGLWGNGVSCQVDKCFFVLGKLLRFFAVLGWIPSGEFGKHSIRGSPPLPIGEDRRVDGLLGGDDRWWCRCRR